MKMKMKKPEFKFSIMFYVPEWADVITKGWATPFIHTKSISQYDDTFLFYAMDGSVPQIVYKNEIFQNYDEAEKKLDIEKKSKTRYYKEMHERASEFLRANNIIL